MFESVYNKLAPTYDQRYSSSQFKEEDERLFSILRGLTKGTVLDVGCGRGLLLENLDIEQSDYLGLDPSVEMLKVFHDKFPGYSTLMTHFEDYQPTHNRETIVSLYGSMSYVSSDSYVKILDMITPSGKYFLMFYKPDYYPHYYTDDMKKMVNASINHKKIDEVFDHTFIFTNYLVATNASL